MMKLFGVREKVCIHMCPTTVNKKFLTNNTLELSILNQINEIISRIENIVVQKNICKPVTCEDWRGRAVKEGSLFIPKEADCNHNVRICKNGKPSEDCYKTTYKVDIRQIEYRKTVCGTIDCDKKQPGCMDKDGNMYKHGEWFVSKGDCNRCLCNHGKVRICRRIGRILC